MIELNSAVAELAGLSTRIPNMYLVASIGCGLCLTLLLLIHGYPRWGSPIRHINGPRPTSLLFGNVVELFTKDASSYELSWSRIFGSVFNLRWAFGESRLYIADPAALHHVLVTNCYSYPKPNQLRNLMSGFMGQGLLFAEGDTHRRQRRVVTPAFGLAANKQYSHIFSDKAKELRERWTSLLREDKGQIMDVASWVACCTIDIIGLAGFNHAFNALSTHESHLVSSLNTVIGTWNASLVGVFQRSIATRFPGLLKIAAMLPFPRAVAVKRCLHIMEEEFRGIFDATAYHNDGEAHDLISSILKANSQTARPKDRLSDAEMMGQVSTVTIAGLETTATAITWALYELARNPKIQQRLREEAQEMFEIKGNEDLEDDDISRMSYLDAFVRELLRFHPAVGSTLRVALKDDVLPLAEPLLARDGKTYLTHIPIKKGQRITIGIFALNRCKAIWGEDADIFRPERWLEYDDYAAASQREAEPGSAYEVDSKGSLRSFTAWSSTLTFLGGPRGCVGWRFAVRECKTILAVLVRSFKFEPRDADTTVLKRTTFVARPVIQGEEALGNQLPLKVSLVARD